MQDIQCLANAAFLDAVSSPCVLRQANAEFWGDVVRAGASPGVKGGLETESAGDCCKACQVLGGCRSSDGDWGVLLLREGVLM